MPYRRDPDNGYIFHRSEEPNANDFVNFYWWVYGGMDYKQYSLDNPPLAYRLPSKELKRFEEFYGAKSIRVNWTLEGLWGGWIAVTKRYYENPRDWAKNEREKTKQKLSLCNELIAHGFPYHPYTGTERRLQSAAFYYERFFMLQWEFNDWENPKYKDAMLALRDIASMVYKGECRVPEPRRSFR